MEIPNVGVLVVRNGIAGVEFLEYLIKETEEICSKPVEERMAKGEMALTKERVQKFEEIRNKEQEAVTIDEKAQNYLKNSLGIDFMNKGKLWRPISADNKSD